MRLAIMQPYFLPYIGYFQLMAAVDKFVLLDDVNYINRGWINRNRIAVNGKPHWLTIPLNKPSQNKLIRDTEIQDDPAWKAKMLRSVETSYGKAPRRAEAAALLSEILDTSELNLSRFLARSLRLVWDHLGHPIAIEPTSSIYPKGELAGQERILDICRREGATTYVNPPGGTGLYDRDRFAAEGVALRFLQPRLEGLTLRCGGEEGPVLSILDLLMFNAPAEIKTSLNSCAIA